MKLIDTLKEHCGFFLRQLFRGEPSNEQVNRWLSMTVIRPYRQYPRPNYGKSGVAAAKRAARKRKNKG